MSNTVLYFNPNTTLAEIVRFLEDCCEYNITDVRRDVRDLRGLNVNRYTITINNHGFDGGDVSKAVDSIIEEDFEIIFEQVIPEELHKTGYTLSQFVLDREAEDVARLVEGGETEKAFDILSSQNGFLRLIGDYSDYNCCAFRSELYTDLYNKFGGLAIVNDKLALKENIYYQKGC